MLVFMSNVTDNKIAAAYSTISNGRGEPMDRSPNSSPFANGIAARGCARENAEPGGITNRVFAGVPSAERERLFPALSRVALSRGDLLNKLANGSDSLYFPLGGMIGLFTVMADGRTIVLAATGREGFIGVSAVLGADVPPSRAVTVVACEALALSTKKLQKVMGHNPHFAANLHRYCSDYLTQVGQIGACHALHSVQQRVALWLLLTREHIECGSALITHELLSELLGCRRPSVSEALSVLEDAGVIHGGRGEIEIIDPSRLATMACECYGSLRWRQPAG